MLGCEDIGQAPEVLRRFWAGVPDADPRKEAVARVFGERDDVVGLNDLWARAVPISLHGDGVPTAGQSLEAISWAGILGHDMPSIDCKLLISGVLSKSKARNTKELFWSVLLWSLQALLDGRFPAEDAFGEAYAGALAARADHYIAGGLFCVLWCVKGDIDWLANGLHLESPSALGGMCCWCKANALEPPLEGWAVAFGLESLPWNDITPAAPWRQTVWSDAAIWLRDHGGDDLIHPLFLLPAVSILNVMADPLHILDLGVPFCVLGNTLSEIAYSPGYLAGNNAVERTAAIWEYIDRQYRARGTPSQLQHLTVSTFTNPQRPHQQSPILTGVKAAMSRHLVPIIADLWGERHDMGVEGDQHIHGLLQGLQSMYESFDTPAYLLTEEQKRGMDTSAEQVLVHYRWLNDNAGEERRWQEIPKFHFMIRIVMQSAFQNPRWSWTYVDEDWMGLVKDVCLSCMVGTPTHRAVAEVVEKWGLGFWARLMRQEH